MINLIYLEKDKISFEINKNTIEDQGLLISPNLLLLGGTELDVKNLYKLKEQELSEEKERLFAQQEEIARQLRNIENQTNIISKQNRKIRDQKNKLEIQKEQEAKQKEKLSELFNEINIQNDNLTAKEIALKLQKEEMIKREVLITKQKDDLSKGKSNLLSLQEKIAKGQKVLLNVEGKLENQKKFIALMAITIILVLFLTIFIFINFKTKQKLNKKLITINSQLNESQVETQQLNEELTATNEELHTTSEQLSLQKDELEKTITSLKEAQTQLIESEKMASVGILTAGIAHEINNPLNFIQGGTLAIEEFINEEAVEYASKLQPLFKSIKTGIQRATNIISSLNHFNRRSEKNDEICNIHFIIDNCIVMLDNQFKNKIEVQKNYDEPNSSILGNEGKLHQLFINILTNAEQSIKDKGKITITSTNEKTKIIITITDTGEGIKEENIKKIINPFFTTKDPGKGTGLGMSIAYNIIKEHKGSISYKSDIGKGTTVTLILPKK